MALQHVLIERQPLETRGLEPVDREIAYGVVRAFYHYHALYTSLVDKPLPSKHGDIYALILAGLYSVDHLSDPPMPRLMPVSKPQASFEKSGRAG